MYDSAIVLGYGFAGDWQLQFHQKERLKKVVSLYQEKIIPKIVVCGKWSVNWDLEGVKPPITEAELARQYLLKHGIPSSVIIKEEYSQDTIGNAYFSKTKIIIPYGFKNLLVICADFHLKRVKYIFKKIFFEKFYKIDFLSTKTKLGKDKEFMKLQEVIFQKQKKFIEKIEKEGGIFLLENYLYNHPYYKEKRPKEIAEAAKGKTY